jgi:ankyrin repeat protein
MNHLKILKVFFIVSTIWLVVLTIKNHFPHNENSHSDHSHTNSSKHKHDHDHSDHKGTSDAIDEIISDHQNEENNKLSFTNRTTQLIDSRDFASFKAYINENPSIKSKINESSKEDGRTLLTRASFGGDLRFVKYLVEELGADINASDSEEITPLMEAVSSENAEVFSYYLENGADIHAKNKLGADALTMALSGHNDKIILSLLKAGANPNHQWNKKNLSHLMLASRNGNVTAAKALLEHGAKINDTDIEGNTALHYASEEGFIEIVKILLNKNADKSIKNKKKKTAKEIALENSFTEIAALLP